MTYKKMFKNLKLSFCILIFIISCSQFTFAEEIDNSVYELILKNNVNDGMVNYNNIKENDIHLLKKYFNQLQNLDIEYFNTLNNDSKIAFWINTYNAITIYGIVKNYPVKYGGLIARHRFPKSSIRQIKNFWDKVFVKIMGKDITLNQIEHKILRKKFNEPRIHFALVCASIGCPKLSEEAYKPDTLNEQLENVTKKFVNDKEQVTLDTANKKLYISSIFKWYAEDFPYDDKLIWLKKYNKKFRGAIQFITKYIEEEKRDFIISSKHEIKYLDYDWSLNDMMKSDS